MNTTNLISANDSRKYYLSALVCLRVTVVSAYTLANECAVNVSLFLVEQL